VSFLSSGLSWAVEHCSRKYVIKMDDDIWVDFSRLMPLVSKTAPKSEFWIQGMLQVECGFFNP
jgi:hypothetical protein